MPLGRNRHVSIPDQAEMQRRSEQARVREMPEAPDLTASDVRVMEAARRHSLSYSDHLVGSNSTWAVHDEGSFTVDAIRAAQEALNQPAEPVSYYGQAVGVGASSYYLDSGHFATSSNPRRERPRVVTSYSLMDVINHPQLLDECTSEELNTLWSACMELRKERELTMKAMMSPRMAAKRRVKG